MEKRLLLAFAVLAFSGLVFAEAYRWVDEDGVVHYSDVPHEGAEIVDLPSSATNRRTRTRPTTPTQTSSSSSSDEPVVDLPFSYESLAVVAPGPEETLWNIEGTLNVNLDLRPGLQQGHRVRVYFDGTPELVDATNFQLQNVYRGVHNVQAEVLDETGKLMIRSVPNRFYVQQNSIGGAP